MLDDPGIGATEENANALTGVGHIDLGEESGEGHGTAGLYHDPQPVPETPPGRMDRLLGYNPCLGNEGLGNREH